MNTFGELTVPEAYRFLVGGGHLDEREIEAADGLRKLFEEIFPDLRLDPEKFRQHFIVAVRRQSSRGSEWDAINAVAAITAASETPIETARIFEMRKRLERMRQPGDER